MFSMVHRRVRRSFWIFLCKASTLRSARKGSISNDFIWKRFGAFVHETCLESRWLKRNIVRGMCQESFLLRYFRICRKVLERYVLCGAVLSLIWLSLEIGLPASTWRLAAPFMAVFPTGMLRMYEEKACGSRRYLFPWNTKCIVLRI